MNRNMDVETPESSRTDKKIMSYTDNRGNTASNKMRNVLLLSKPEILRYDTTTDQKPSETRWDRKQD